MLTSEKYLFQSLDGLNTIWLGGISLYSYNDK